MATVTNTLLKEYNAIRGLSYPNIGYCFYADIRGDGNYRPSVYTIVNEGGGVTRSDLNAKSPRLRCEKIRAAIIKARCE